MYPDTDSPPVKITPDLIKKLKKEISSPAYEIEDKWIKAGVPVRITEKAVVSPFINIFDTLLNDGKYSPEFIWSTLCRLNHNGYEVSESMENNIFKVFDLFNTDKISRDTFIDVIESIPSDGDLIIDDLIKEYGLITVGSKDVQTKINDLIKETKAIKFSCDNSRIDYICGRVKKDFKNRIDSRELHKEISQKLK